MISDENILAAIKEVNKTHRWRKHHTPNKIVMWVEATIPERIIELRQMIEDGFEPSPAIPKRVWDESSEKWRDIFEPKLYPDQYIHHILVQVIQKLIMRGMDKWVCGSIPGRGIHYGVRAIQKWMRDKNKTRYCGEFDIRHFYQNIKPKIVLRCMKKIIKDWRVLDLAERIIRDGIVIGFYTSQWFANLVLRELDKMIRKLADRYIRYMDNITIFMSNKRKLRKLRLKISAWLGENYLKLKDNWQIFRTDKRLPSALGYRYGKDFSIPRKRNLFRLKKQLSRTYRRMRKMGRATIKQACGILSRLGQLKWCNRVQLFGQFVRTNLQRQLKNVVRRTQRKERAKWNILSVNQPSIVSQCCS